MAKNFRSRLIFLILLISFGISIKSNAQKAAIGQEQLEYLVLEISGRRQILKNSETLTVIEGDEIKFIEAMLWNKKKAELINLIGYRSPNATNNNDRNILINTEKMDTRWETTPESGVYVVKVETSKIEQGQAFIKILRPKLKYIEVLINNERKIIRENDILKVKLTDQLKVDKIITNLNNKSGVKFLFREVISASNDQPIIEGAKIYEIEFFLNKKKFARIPMLVENL